MSSFLFGPIEDVIHRHFVFIAVDYLSVTFFALKT
jgi:hypothetical protein